MNAIQCILEETGFPYAYGYFSNKSDYDLEAPYVIYQLSHSHNFIADNKIYSARNVYKVSLYTNKKDDEDERKEVRKDEQKLEDMLAEYGLVWDKAEEFIEVINGVGLFKVTYTVEVIEECENNDTDILF